MKVSRVRGQTPPKRAGGDDGLAGCVGGTLRAGLTGGCVDRGTGDVAEMTPGGGFDVVTGAYGYTGRYIARRLLAMGRKVLTLTGHPNRPDIFGGQVAVAPYAFENPGELTRSLGGATTLYNTYWVRFPRGPVTFERAVGNTEILLRAAREAGVGKIVHLSVTGASADSDLPYFRGKGAVEAAIVRSGLSYAILRPTVIFGAEDILINNMAWLLRHFPIFALPGSGRYLLQPIFVDDVAEMAVAAAQVRENTVIDAAGPETFTFEELVRLIRDSVDSRARILHVRPGLALFLAGLAGLLVRDVVLTRDEVAGLMANLLVSDKPPTGKTPLGGWLRENAEGVGRRYASELDRHFR